MKKIYRLMATVLVVGMVASFLTVALAGCTSNDPLAEQFRAGDNKNYIAGDGSVTEFAAGSRPGPVVWSGSTESGSILASSALKGVPHVINFWYAGCAPCRAEAPDLVSLAETHKDVQFVGVNVRDSAATALAFDKKFGISWPSIIDATSGSVVLAFTGIVTPAAVPTTLVVDADGKVTARVLGRIDKSILNTLIKTAKAD